MSHQFCARTTYCPERLAASLTIPLGAFGALKGLLCATGNVEATRFVLWVREITNSVTEA